METTVNQDQGSAFTSRDYLRILFRQKMVIFIAILAGSLATFIGLKLQTKMYVATVKMVITAQKEVDSPYYKEAYVSREMQQAIQQSEIVKSDPVLKLVVMAQSLDKRPLDDEKKFASSLKGRVIALENRIFEKSLEAMPADQRDSFLYRRAMALLKESIKVDPIRDTNMFTISVRDYDPVMAAIIANTISRAYVIFDLEQQLAELNTKYGHKHPTVRYVQDNIDKMRKKLDGQRLTDIDAIGPATVKIIEQAAVPLKPSGTSKGTTFILAIALSVFLGLFLAFVFEFLDQTIKAPRDIDVALNIPCLGSIRRRRSLEPSMVDFAKKLSAYGHSYQTLCDFLFLRLKDKGISSVMISATLRSEETQVVISNMAAYFARGLKQKVLLVDADLRMPLLHKVYGLANDRGLADYLESKAGLKEIVLPAGGSLSLVPAGQTDLNPMVLFDSDKTADFIKEAKSAYDLVLIRSASTHDHQDPAILVRYMDGFLVLVDEGKVRRHMLQAAFNPLRDKARHMLGVLLVNRTYPIPQWIYDRL